MGEENSSTWGKKSHLELFKLPCFSLCSEVAELLSKHSLSKEPMRKFSEVYGELSNPHTYSSDGLLCEGGENQKPYFSVFRDVHFKMPVLRDNGNVMHLVSC